MAVMMMLAAAAAMLLSAVAILISAVAILIIAAALVIELNESGDNLRLHILLRADGPDIR